MTFLFVGGHADGKRIAIQNPTAPYRVPHFGYAVSYDVYYPMQFAGSSDEHFTIYVYESMSGSDVLRRLIDGYRQEQPKAMSA